MEVPKFIRENETTLSAAASQVLPLQGSFVKVFSSTGDFKINLGGGFQRAREGSVFSGVVFSQLEVLNTSGGTNTIVLKYGDADYSDTSVTGGIVVSGTVSSKPSASGMETTDDVVIPTGGSAQLLLAAKSRSSVLVQRIDTNSAKCRIGDSNVSATRGTQLVQDANIELKNDGAIYVFNNSGSDMTFTLLEEI